MPVQTQSEGDYNMKKQTAGRDRLGDFAPKFAELNDDVLFGQVWSREVELSPRDRSMITVAALISGGNFEQLPNHLKLARENGLTKAEITEIITQLAFYCGWPKAWSAFNLAKDIFAVDNTVERSTVFPKGELIRSDNFIGNTYLHILVKPEEGNGVTIANVTFSPGARNNWHSHEIGQVLLVTGGKGYYQEDGKPAQLLLPGNAVNIPAAVRHWHGAAPDSWFVHIAVTRGKAQWFDPLDDKRYLEAVK
jgi:alkylhydroperoxidase/carboxymuconolactone decarboxylase family protein YurZ/quercetin dioxygenase-like cupin family protein